MKRWHLSILAAVFALAALLPATAGTAAAAEIDTLQSRKITARNIWQVATRTARVRDKCARSIEKGTKPWTVNCNENPRELGGSGTGAPAVNAKLLLKLGQPIAGYRKLRSKGTPSEHGVDGLCSPPSNDWDEIDSCVRDYGDEASRVIFDLRFNPTPRTPSVIEIACRKSVGRALRGAYLKLIKHRVNCFVANGLDEGGNIADDNFECRAPSVPPSTGKPITGHIPTDNRLFRSRRALSKVLVKNCPDNLAGASYPGSLSDPTGGLFSRNDLHQLHIAALLKEIDPVLDGLYPNQDHCGDGVTQNAIGEECDDGNHEDCDGCESNCMLPGCGNSVGCFDDGEECDDGDDDDEDGCTATCTLEFCGDGNVQAGLGEECDDGNLDSGDGCDENCTVTACGNEIITAGEECDDGAFNSNTRRNACRLDCRLPHCGDGVTDSGEFCDELAASSFCDVDCTNAECGDGTVNPAAGEECDDANANNTDSCPDGEGGTCRPAFCGDGFTRFSVEQCDDGNPAGGDGCSSSCAFEFGWTCSGSPTTCDENCGDGVQVGAEECDDGDFNNNDGCDFNCTITRCGNGVTAGAELCDDGNESNTDACPDGNGGSCRPARCGDGFTHVGVEDCDHVGESALCDADCTVAFCGDGTRNVTAGETCDDGNTVDGDGCSSECRQ